MMRSPTMRTSVRRLPSAFTTRPPRTRISGAGWWDRARAPALTGVVPSLAAPRGDGGKGHDLRAFLGEVDVDDGRAEFAQRVDCVLDAGPGACIDVVLEVLAYPAKPQTRERPIKLRDIVGNRHIEARAVALVCACHDAKHDRSVFG